MSGWHVGAGLGNLGDVRNALKDVTNTRTSAAEERVWNNASHDGHGGSKDCESHDDYDGDARRKPSSGYFRCGSEGHMMSECPEPPKPLGECFNCIEIGQPKADSSKRTVARPCAGACNICQEESHRANECPPVPTKHSKNWVGSEVGDHTAASCKNRDKIQHPPVVEGQAEEAWHLLEAAAREGDMEDVKEAMKMYTDALPDVTYVDLEEAFRNMNIPVYLVAIEKSVINSFTIIDLQGNIDKQYAVWIRKSPQPSRPYEAEMWPATSEENFERLKDAGVVESRMAVCCCECGELGHTRKYCQDAVSAVKQGSVFHCHNCGEHDHRYKDCQQPREDKNACRNSKLEPRNLDNANYDVDDQMGHFGRYYPTTGGSGGGDRELNECFNRDPEEHIPNECSLPPDYPRVLCTACGEMGHTAVGYKSGGDYAGNHNTGEDLMETDGGGWDAPVAAVQKAEVKTSEWTKIPEANDKVDDESPISESGGSDVLASIYSSSSKGSSQADTPPSASQASIALRTGFAGHPSANNGSLYAPADSPWSVNTPPSAVQGSTAPRTGFARHPNSEINVSPNSTADSRRDDTKTPSSGRSTACRPSEKAEESWDSWGICAHEGEVDQCTGNRQYQKSTGSGRIFSDTKIIPGEKLRPLFYDDGKNRHMKLVSNLPIIPSPLGDVPVTADNRFSQFTYNHEDGEDHGVSQLSLTSDDNDDDIQHAGGVEGRSPSPIATVYPANNGPAGTRSSIPAYAYQPTRGPVGSGARPLAIKSTSAAFISKAIPTTSVEDALVVAAAIPLPPTPQAAAKFMPPYLAAVNAKLPGIKSTPSPLGPATRPRASTVGKPFLPPHMATPTRPVERATDLPYRDMEHLERTPPPKGAEVFFDHNVAEYAVVDESAPASPTATTPEGAMPPSTGPPAVTGW